jgi:EpsI family protein
MMMNANEVSNKPFTLTRRSLAIGAILTAASGVAFARQPQIAYPPLDKETFRSWLPARLGDWQMMTASSIVLPPADALSDRLYDNLITRVYAAPEMPEVMLLIAYNNTQDGVLQVHRPEVCYPVGGFELSRTRAIPLNIGRKEIQANIFTATAADRTEQVVYFTRVGSAFPRTWADQRIAVVEENLARRIPDGLLFRISCLDGSQERAANLLGGFLQDFYANSSPRLQNLLIGETA